MGKFIIVTFLMLGWAFHELSGGADFVPEERPVAVAEVAVETLPEPADEPVALVTRASTTNLTIAPEVPVAEVVEVATPAPEVAAEAAVQTEEITAALEEAVAPALAPLLDLRAVAGSRVNMRSGPGTSFDVLDTLPQGTEAEVIEVNADGWARIRVLESGAEGWMAERLLTEI